MNRLLNLKTNSDIEEALCPYHDAFNLYKKYGLNTLQQTLRIAEMLYQNTHFETASLFYLYAFKQQNTKNTKYPSPTNILYLSLLSLLKAGKSLPSEELSELEKLSKIHANNLLGIQAAWQMNNAQEALSLVGNGFEHFYSGDQIDTCYLEFALKYFTELTAPIDASSYSPIPHRLYSYWEGEVPQNIQENIEFHKEMLGEEFIFFDKEMAGEWLLNQYGLEVFNLFQKTQTSKEASEIFRTHLILQRGGWWIDPKLRLKSKEAWLELARLPKNGRFYVNHHSLIRHSFFGATPNNPILSNVAITFWTNKLRFQSVASYDKTSSGLFTRAVNRALYNHFTNEEIFPSIAIGTTPQMFSIVAEF